MTNFKDYKIKMEIQNLTGLTNDNNFTTYNILKEKYNMDDIELLKLCQNMFIQLYDTFDNKHDIIPFFNTIWKDNVSYWNILDLKALIGIRYGYNSNSTEPRKKVFKFILFEFLMNEIIDDKYFKDMEFLSMKLEEIFIKIEI